ncbi:conserved exported hypothetical protein [Vibrio jasicida]|uniref:Uncharacterized protein n=1 Tax=Vibrio jasicida TaxID=766224 RepID=A0AAU9QXP7_9VIBR|nr:conserved exported hypothetical protein [Vibrio jasicida]CAH1603614.1 conserved exported hypothetical protein [Vibrio jasicida]
MKKQAMMMALLSAGLIGQSAHAMPSTATLEWTGFVPGVFNGSDIGLTGQGGGDIQAGVLKIEEDGAFTALRPVVVEAHEMIDTSVTQDGSQMEPGPGLYDGDVVWSLLDTSVTHTAYDAATDITITMNGTDLVKGTPVTTTTGNHIATFGADSAAPTAGGSVVPGDSVAVQAVIMAAPSTGGVL